MSKNYSANQFENAFNSTRIQNWEIPKSTRGLQAGVSKNSKSIVDEQHHSLSFSKKNNGVRKFSNFVGTWDMPRKLPSAKMNVKTGRSELAYENLQEEFRIPREILSGERAPEKLSSKIDKALRNKLKSKITKSKAQFIAADDDDFATCPCNGVSFDNTVNYIETNEDLEGFGNLNVGSADEHGSSSSGRIMAF